MRSFFDRDVQKKTPDKNAIQQVRKTCFSRTGICYEVLLLSLAHQILWQRYWGLAYWCAPRAFVISDPTNRGLRTLNAFPERVDHGPFEVHICGVNIQSTCEHENHLAWFNAPAMVIIGQVQSFDDVQIFQVLS